MPNKQGRVLQPSQPPEPPRRGDSRVDLQARGKCFLVWGVERSAAAAVRDAAELARVLTGKVSAARFAPSGRNDGPAVSAATAGWAAEAPTKWG